MNIRHFAAIAAAATVLMTTSASANDFSFAGTFKKDNSKAIVVFKVVAPGNVTFQTSGYAAGGFDPVVSLYNPNGDFIDDNDDGVSGSDSYLQATLSPGKYRLYLTQYNNFGPASVRSDGFAYDAQPDFRSGFVDSQGNVRTSSWALDVRNVSEAAVLSNIGAVPEPSTWAMMIGGFGIVGAATRRRKRRATVTA